MTKAFRLNLMILSLIAMMVSAYLILQALDAAVVRRRGEIATLKSPRPSVPGQFALPCCWEAAFIGLIGSALGIVLGSLLAIGAVQVLVDTVNALYFATSVESIELRASDLWVGLWDGYFVESAGKDGCRARDAMLTPPAQILARGDWVSGVSLAAKAPGPVCY